MAESKADMTAGITVHPRRKGKGEAAHFFTSVRPARCASNVVRTGRVRPKDGRCHFPITAETAFGSNVSRLIRLVILLKQQNPVLGSVFQPFGDEVEHRIRKLIQ